MKENNKVELFTEKEKANIAAFMIGAFIGYVILKDMHDRGVFDDTYKKILKEIDNK